MPRLLTPIDIARRVNADSQYGRTSPITGTDVEEFWLHYPLGESHPLSQLIWFHTPTRIKKVILSTDKQTPRNILTILNANRR